MKITSKLFLSRSSLFYLILILVLYLISYRLGFTTGTTIFGIPLFLYFPGSVIVQQAKPIIKTFGKFGRFSLVVIFSFCISSLIGLIIQNAYGFNSVYQIWAIVLFDIIGLLIVSVISKYHSKQSQNIPSDNKTNYQIRLLDYLPVAIFFVAMLAVVAFNPLPQNLDNYFNIFKLSILENTNFLLVREIFISSLGVSNQILKLNIYYLYTYLYIVLFFISTLVFYDYLLRNFKGKRSAIYLIYLSFLISPAILTEIIRTMSQVALLSLTIPALILSIESIRNKRISLGVTSLILAIISLLFHELGIILVATAFITLLINGYRLIFIDKKSTGTKLFILIFLLIAVIFFYRSAIFAPIIQRLSFRLQQNFSLITTNGGVHWHWWFLSNYKTVEGIQLGWTGKGAVLYYLYGGILLFLPLAYVGYFFVKNKLRLGLEAIPTLLYFLFYFSAAEILPRMNLAFLPNRAWVHMMLPAVILLALMYEKLSAKNIKIKYFELLLIVLIVVGYAGTLYLAKINIYEVYPTEMGVANYIKEKTPSNSVFISSQGNSSLVDLYGERPYGQIMVDHQINQKEFETAINKTLESLSHDQFSVYDLHSLQAPMHYTVDEKTGSINLRAPYTKGDAVYFLYSYAKTGGLNDERSYRQTVVDSMNKSTYSKFNYDIVYSDPNAILLKIR